MGETPYENLSCETRELWTVHLGARSSPISIQLLRAGSHEDDQLKVLKPVGILCFLGEQLEPRMSNQVHQLGVLSVCQYHGELTDLLVSLVTACIAYN